MLGRKPQYKKQSLKKLSQKYPLTLPTTLSREVKIIFAKIT